VRSQWLIGLALIFGCNSGSATPAQPPPPVVAATPAPAAAPAPTDPPGKTLYLQLCAACHGKDAKGYAADHAPSLVNPTFLESATDDFLRKSIALGRPGTSMAAYGKQMGGPLDETAVHHIIAFLREGGPPTKPLTPGGKGDATRGAKLYATTCKVCHGDQTSRGESVHLANVRFLQQATDPFIRYAIEVGRPGTKMGAFKDKLTAAQIDDVVAYVRTLGGDAANLNLLPEPTGKEPLVLNPSGKEPEWQIRDLKFIGVDQVNKAMTAKRKLVIIDARPPSDWRRAHIKGAVSIPYFDLKRLGEIPKDAWAIAYCACPHHLSGIVVDELIKRGHTKALVLDEGINEWQRRGYPTTAAQGVKPPPKEAPGADHAPPHPHHDHAHPH
jgi:cytochrome c oxidase cbb3-type subunit III